MERYQDTPQSINVGIGRSIFLIQLTYRHCNNCVCVWVLLLITAIQFIYFVKNRVYT